MKYLFIVQGEGRGHLTQAIALSNILRKNNHQVVGVLVGKCKARAIPEFFLEKIGAPVKTYHSPNFIWNKNNTDVQLLRTVVYNLRAGKLKKFNKSMEMIHEEISIKQPDVVINFYEILAGLTNLRFNEEVPFISIAHQFLIMHPKYKYGKGTEQGKLYLRLNALICSIGSVKKLALSLYPIKDSIQKRIAVVPPLLREEVLNLKPTNENYILGYMVSNGYAAEVIKWHKENPEQEIHIFWDKKDEEEELVVDNNLTFHKINDTKFLEYMAGCKAYITTAGFESVCEAMYLGKPIMMIPTHIEQEINALDASEAGAGIVSKSFNLTELLDYSKQPLRHKSDITHWIEESENYYIRHLTTLV